MRLSDEYFSSGYWHSMDKQKAYNLGFSPNYLGISAHPARSQVEGLKSRIFQGASHVELGFFGRETGSLQQGSPTPETYSKEEREAIKQLARINEINLTTHASPNIPNLSGLSEQGFKEEVAESALHEIERAVDFAADTTKGGPVVVHTGGFPREVSKYKREGFEAYPQESEKAPIYLVDKRTGNLQVLPREAEIPVYKLDKNGQPIRNSETGFYEFESKTIRQIEKEELGKGKTAAEAAKSILEHFRKEREELYEGQQEYYGRIAREINKELKTLENVKESYDKVLQSAKDKEAVKIFLRNRLEQTGMAPSPHRNPEEFEKFLAKPEEFLDKHLTEAKRQSKLYDENVASYGRQLHQIREENKHMVTVEEEGIRRTADTLARAAIFAYEKEKAKGLDKPLIIAPENLYPEAGHFSHPKELKQLILKSREEMANKLEKERHMSRSQAEKIAADHIKATFDVGHANTWRKFFKGSDKEFNEWLVNQVDDLAREGIIGHVHLSDNFGYYDTHITPGEGTVPFKEFLEKLKKAGYKDKMIVEPAHQDWKAWTGAMRNIGSPIYRVDHAWRTWTDIESSYFGQTRAPAYIVGGYAPDVTLRDENRTWRFWSETGLE